VSDGRGGKSAPAAIVPAGCDNASGVLDGSLPRRTHCPNMPLNHPSKESAMPPRKTAIDLKSNTKTAAIELLNAILADSIDLALVTKQAHWNLKGLQFIAIHEMLDNFRAEIDGHADTVAERAVQLGGFALGTSQTVAASTKLAPYPTEISKIKDHLAQLIERYAHVANEVRKGIDKADDIGDADTTDILTAYSRSLDKALWFLESHVE
jgi:starvation-inducible DNA-binding protein